MKLITMTLREAEYGGYTYVDYPKIVLQGVFKPHNEDIALLQIVNWISKNVHIDHKLSIDRKSLTKLLGLKKYNDHHDKNQALDIIKEKITNLIRSNKTDELDIYFWNASNWSESHLTIEITEISEWK